MSRSVRKTMGYCDRSPFMKNQANRKIRRLSVEDMIANGSEYKKHFCSWDICDFRCVSYTKQQVRRNMWEIWCRDIMNGWEDRLPDSFDLYVASEITRISIK